MQYIVKPPGIVPAVWRIYQLLFDWREALREALRERKRTHAVDIDFAKFSVVIIKFIN